MGGQSSFKTTRRWRPSPPLTAAQREASMRGRGRFFGVRRWPTDVLPSPANGTQKRSLTPLAVSHPANPTDPKRRRVVGNGAGIVQRLGRRLTKPQMQVRLPLPASPCPFLNARLLTPRGVF